MELKYLVLFALLFVPLSAAIGGPGGMGQGGMNGNGPGGMNAEWAQAKAEMLDGSIDNVICKTGFMAGVLESVMENVNGTEGLQDEIDTLESDVDALQGYADSGDGYNYRLYLHESFAPHMVQAKDAIKDAGKGATVQARLQMRTDYDSLHDEYKSCNDESLERFANAKVNAYDVALEKAQERADNLSAKGVDTSAIDSLIEDAQEQVVDPLKDALDAAENGSDVKDAIGQYCLFNGCKNGLNFHFWLKFEAEKLDAVLASISDDAEAAGLSGEVDSAQADIDSARGSIDEIEDGRYDSGAGKAVIDSLHDAAQAIKDILHELRSV